MNHVLKEKLLKWNKKTKQLILVGYVENVKDYSRYGSATNTAITCRNIVIMETSADKNFVLIPVECKLSEGDSMLEEKNSKKENKGDATFVPDSKASSVSTSNDSSSDITAEKCFTLTELN